mmetsp:Transcript_26074/g.83188  ORF Transcript_26074/g.83188 Transcript_26074/m.83188 type:complete len:221 (-) Transcript_26074:8-670(-)
MVDPKALRHVVLPRAVGRHAHRVGAHPVVAVAEGDQVVVPRVGPRHHHGHVVRLGAGVDKVNVLEVPGHAGSELLCILADLRVEVDGGRVLQELVLLHHGVHHLWMAVTDANGDDSRERVEVALAGVIEEVLHLALHDCERLLVEVEHSWVEELRSHFEDLLRGGPRVGHGDVVKSGHLRDLHGGLEVGHGQRREGAGPEGPQGSAREGGGRSPANHGGR